MSKIKAELENKCELALMGKVISVENNDEVRFVTEYLLQALGFDDNFYFNNFPENPDWDIIDDCICKYSPNNRVTHIVVNIIMGQFRCITYCIDTQEKDEPKPFEEDYGSGYPASFTYVLNLDAVELSEFGDCFFQKMNDGYYHKVS